MYASLYSITSLLLSVIILQLSQSLQASLIAVRADAESFSTTMIGMIGTAFFAGFIVSGKLVPIMIRRAGHIRTFAALASAFSAVALMHAVIIEPYAWIFLRFASGVCVAGLLMVTESWINDQTNNAHRGNTLSVYIVLYMGAGALGQMILPFGDAGGYTLFVVVSVLASISLLPVLMSKTSQPVIVDAARMGYTELYEKSPLGFIGCLMIGVAQGGFFAMGALMAVQLGLGSTGVATFMSFFIFGSMISQWPFGWLSDHIDRRYVIILCSLGVALISIILAGSITPGSQVFYGLMALLGATMVPLYSLFIAHVNDFVDHEDMTEANAGLISLFGMGAVTGPLLVGTAMELWGAIGFYGFFALNGIGIAAFALWRATQRQAIPADERDNFIPIARDSLTLAEMDPRTPDELIDDELEGENQVEEERINPSEAQTRYVLEA